MMVDCVACDDSGIFFGEDCPVCVYGKHWGDNNVQTEGKLVAEPVGILTGATSTISGGGAAGHDKNQYRMKAMPSPSSKCALKPGDWECSACSFANFARRCSCKQCGLARPIKPGDWWCECCGDYQFARNSRCRSCGSPKSPAPKKPCPEATCSVDSIPQMRALNMPGADVRIGEGVFDCEQGKMIAEFLLKQAPWETCSTIVGGRRKRENHSTCFFCRFARSFIRICRTV